MTIASLYTALNSTKELAGRVFYSHKTADVKMPFLFIERVGETYEYADDSNYEKLSDDCAIELYTANFAPALEAVVDDVLKTNGVTFTKVSSWDNDGAFFLVAYSITLTN